MNYAFVRPQIANGDVLAIKGRSWFARLTRLVQKIAGLGAEANVTHIGIAWWLEGRLWSIEMDGRHNVARPVSQYINSGLAVDVYRVAAAQYMAETFETATSDSILYGELQNVRIGMRLLFGIAANSGDKTQMVCSTFVARWLQWAGWKPPDKFPNMPCPAELCQALKTPIFKIKDSAA